MGSIPIRPIMILMGTLNNGQTALHSQTRSLNTFTLPNNLNLGNPIKHLETGVYLTPGSTAFPGAQTHYLITLMQ